jgi:hypothetical protein
VDVGRMLLGALGVGKEPLAQAALDTSVRHADQVGSVWNRIEIRT